MMIALSVCVATTIPMDCDCPAISCIVCMYTKVVCGLVPTMVALRNSQDDSLISTILLRSRAMQPHCQQVASMPHTSSLMVHCGWELLTEDSIAGLQEKRHSLISLYQILHLS